LDDHPLTEMGMDVHFGAEIVSGEIFAPPSASAEPETEMARF
jgi:hypothetical protein